ncbi:MAG: 1-deoxy-D-xylulose-5-phosphate synthase, partial [Synergistales bacterium]|nr:1-deoxy-D-xylulose-5-phosphate synthase [Synergistales bacterium]
MSILDKITNYRDLKGLSHDSLKLLCKDLRRMIIQVVMDNGGHLGSPLGAVELTVALLRQFDPLKDKIIFDVGHQCYAYKILTDRRERFSTLRKWGGISGYPKREESSFDHFDVGHSSTSLSAALGYGKARDILKKDHEVVAIVGDGSLLNGVAFEALNYVSEASTKVIFILNDNTMCISPRVGGFATYLARLSSNIHYRRLKGFVREISLKMPKGERIERFLEGFKEKVKGL